MAHRAHRAHRHARPLVAGAVLVVIVLSRTSGAADVGVDGVVAAPGGEQRGVRGEAAPAVAAPLDAASTASAEPDADDLEDPEHQGNETLLEDSGGREARFLGWGSLSRDSSREPHPTVATFSHRASQLSDILMRAAKFLSAFASPQEDEAANEVDVDEAERKEGQQDDDSPASALAGMYSECLLRLSVPCVQRKLLLFLDRLGRMERFRLLGDFLTVVRVEPRNGEARHHDLDEDADVTDLAAMVDRLVDDFFETHVLRFSLPGTLRVGRAPRTTVDISLDRPAGQEDDDDDDGGGPDEGGGKAAASAAAQGRALVEGRGSLPSLGGGGGNSKKKQKMIKKIKKKLMKLLMMGMSVMMAMGPMMGGMAGNTSGMALMIGTLAIILLKSMMIKQMGGSMTQLFSNLGNSVGNLAGIPGLPGSQGQGTNYQPTGTGGGPYARTDYVYPNYQAYQAYQPNFNQPYANWAGRAADGGDSWFSGLAGLTGLTSLTDPMSLAYRAYSVASHFK